jgi:GntR family transcriptional regulator
MHFHVNSANGIPIYEQIARHIKFAVANQSLQVGEHVLSVREMATRLAVNANTVARAYRNLQSDGVLVSIRGTGLAVTPEAPAICRDERLNMIRERLRSVLAEAYHNQITPDEVRGLVDAELAALTTGATDGTVEESP